MPPGTDAEQAVFASRLATLKNVAIPNRPAGLRGFSAVKPQKMEDHFDVGEDP